MWKDYISIFAKKKNKWQNYRKGMNASTEDNIRVVIRFLSSQNFGVWDLPKMEIGYSAHQFDCGGKIAMAMAFDKPNKQGLRKLLPF